MPVWCVPAVVVTSNLEKTRNAAASLAGVAPQVRVVRVCCAATALCTCLLHHVQGLATCDCQASSSHVCNSLPGCLPLLLRPGGYCNGWSACQSEFGWCNSTADVIPAGYTYPGGRCGKQAGGLHCVDGQCCSADGVCGYSPDYCNADSQPDAGNTVVPPELAPNLTVSYIGGPCGPTAGPNGGLRCPDYSCCSEYGMCGVDETDDFYCGAGCLAGYSSWDGTPGTCAPQLKQLGTGKAQSWGRSCQHRHAVDETSCWCLLPDRLGEARQQP